MWTIVETLLIASTGGLAVAVVNIWRDGRSRLHATQQGRLEWTRRRLDSVDEALLQVSADVDTYLLTDDDGLDSALLAVEAGQTKYPIPDFRRFPGWTFWCQPAVTGSDGTSRVSEVFTVYFDSFHELDWADDPPTDALLMAAIDSVRVRDHWKVPSTLLLSFEFVALPPGLDTTQSRILHFGGNRSSDIFAAAGASYNSTVPGAIGKRLPTRHAAFGPKPNDLEMDHHLPDDHRIHHNFQYR